MFNKNWRILYFVDKVFLLSFLKSNLSIFSIDESFFFLSLVGIVAFRLPYYFVKQIGFHSIYYCSYILFLTYYLPKLRYGKHDLYQLQCQCCVHFVTLYGVRFVKQNVSIELCKRQSHFALHREHLFPWFFTFYETKCTIFSYNLCVLGVLDVLTSLFWMFWLLCFGCFDRVKTSKTKKSKERKTLPLHFGL